MDACTLVPAQPYKLTDEERLALGDIVRYGDINKMTVGLRNKLLFAFAEATVLALYGPDNRPMPNDLEEEELPEWGPSQCDILVQFTKLQPLPSVDTSDAQCNG